MVQELRVIATDGAGVPRVDVPCDCMWDLIEYLSYQRVAVHYDFHDAHFTVTFPKQSAASVQQLLDHWAHSDWAQGDAAHGMAGSSARSHQLN
jgi:hypothetical protein